MAQRLRGVTGVKIRVPPEREGVLRRAAVVDGLRASGRPIVLVQAPGGYGKTTALSQWAGADARPFAWVSLDHTEADPTMFWRHVFSALAASVPGFESEAGDELAEAAPNIVEVVLPLLVEGLDGLSEPLVIVLDDYQRAISPEVDRTLGLFLSHLPDGVTLVVAARSQPNLGLDLLRSQGAVFDVGTSSLAFTPDESAAMLAGSRPDLTDSEIAQIQQSTEGWPAGVYLHASAPKRGDRLSPKADIRAYLAAEMLSGLSPEVRGFLLETSILSHLVPDLVDHVTRRADGHVTLRSLSNSNLLLVPLDEMGTTYRYHHLLGEQLEDLALDELGQSRMAELHGRAAGWHAERGDPSEAVRHGIASGAVAEAVDVVLDHWYEYLMTGRGGVALGWLASFSDRDFESHPRLALAGALLEAFVGDERRAVAHAETATRHARMGSDAPGFSGTHGFQSSAAIMAASLVADGPGAALADARRAAQLESPASPYRPLLAAMMGTFIYSTAGDSAAATALLVEATDPVTGPTEIAAYALGNLALMCTWQGDDDHALDFALKAIDAVDEAKARGLVVYGLPYAVAALHLAERGDEQTARSFVRVAIHAEDSASNAAPFDAMTLRVALAEALVALEDFDAAREQVRRASANLVSMADGGLARGRINVLAAQLNNLEPAGGAVETAQLLTARELEVLRLLAEGGTLEEVGEELFVSRNTVKTHAASIYRKLGASSRSQAAATAARLGLL